MRKESNYLNNKDAYLTSAQTNGQKQNMGKNLRKYLLEKEILKYDDYTGEKIFKEAIVDTSVLLLKNEFKKIMKF